MTVTIKSAEGVNVLGLDRNNNVVSINGVGVDDMIQAEKKRVRDEKLMSLENYSIMDRVFGEILGVD